MRKLSRTTHGQQSIAGFDQHGPRAQMLASTGGVVPVHMSTQASAEQTPFPCSPRRDDGGGIAFRENWSSLHVGGVNFSRADGSTLFLTLTVDTEIIKALMTIDGGDSAANQLR